MSRTKSSARPARTFRGTPRNLALLARQLQRGELVAVPTETVYGLAANALDASACRKIFAVKGRPTTDPLIVHLHTIAQWESVCVPNDAARRLASRFWPGPLTLVLPKAAAVPLIVTARRDTVAVRVPAHPLFRRLLKLTGVPVAAPSANPFGYVSPTTAQHVIDGLGHRIRFILDGGATAIGLESTIVDVRDEKRPRLLRPGAITRKQLEQALGRPVVVAHGAQPATTRRAQIAPGMLERHYSPRTPVLVHDALPETGAADEAYVYFRRPTRPTGRNVFWLDARGNAQAAARRLFAMLRRLDAAGFRRLHFELAPDGGIAEAINDRLRRAAAKRERRSSSALAPPTAPARRHSCS